MRLFLSYRRDDTAGRAGRLFDGLTQRLGPGQVFQDVEGIPPGLDFEQALVEWLDRADASVVVIGADWATAAEADGRRRLDHDDDYVRREVGAALASGRPVVPVLVGGAQLPRADELPADLQPLLRRQAFTVRDGAWNDDVDDLVRHLRSQLPAPSGPRRRRFLVAAAVLVLVVVGVVAALLLRPDGDAADGDTTTSTGSGVATTTDSGVRPTCTVLDPDTLTMLDVVAAPPTQITVAGRILAYRAVAVAAQEREDGWRVLADIEVANESSDNAQGTGDWYITPTDFTGVEADGTVGEGAADCFNIVSGSQTMTPGDLTVVRVGFDGPADPRSSELVLRTAGPPVPLAAP